MRRNIDRLLVILVVTLIILPAEEFSVGFEKRRR
jgi:hypothetical protein